MAKLVEQIKKALRVKGLDKNADFIRQ